MVINAGGNTMICQNFAVEDFTDEESLLVKAIHRVIFENESVPAKKIANHLNIQYKTLSKMCSIETLHPSVPKFPLIKLPKLAELVDIEPIVDAVCMIGGFVPGRVYDVKIVNEKVVNPLNTLTKTQETAKQMALLIQDLIEALEDNILTKQENERLKKQINELKKSIASIEAYLDLLSF
mgnify:CR=1 FL=1